MSSTLISAIISLVAYVLSVITTVFIIGVRWGKLSSDIDHMKTDLAEIKGMFKLTPKE